MTAVPGYNATVTCPYDSSHNNILKERFQIHFVKCSKNHPNVVLKTCPFNVTHLICERDLDDHVRECEDRANFDLYRFPIAAPVVAPQENRAPAPVPVYDPLPPGDDDWEDDGGQGYDPQAYVERAPVIRQLSVAPRAERRAFREAERLRLNQMRQ